MTPSNFSSAPIGIWIGTGLPFSRSRMCPYDLKKVAPTRSILLMKASRGTRYLFAWRHTVSDCGCTPATASYTCLLYTSDAADERSSVDLGGRRIIKKKK